MALARKKKVHDQCVCTVSLEPVEVDAGREIALRVSAACPEGCDLAGLLVSIRDAEGNERASASLAPDGDAAERDDSEDEERARPFATGPIVLATPAEAGTHQYTAVLVEDPGRGIIHRASPASASVTTKPHETFVNVWELPSVVTVGDPFRFRVGAKCTSECAMTGRVATLRDEEGIEVATGTFGTDLWPGTSALYHTEITAVAPDEPGPYRWTLEVAGAEGGPPHELGVSLVAVRALPKPDFEVTVHTVDRASQDPIGGARIVMHPYRAVSDESGTAVLRVTRGDYTVLVSGRKYLPTRTTISVHDHMTTRAELEREPPPPNPDDFYY